MSWLHLSALSRRSLRLGGEVFPRAFTGRDAENAEVAQRMIANQDTTRTCINTNVTEY